MSSLARTYRSEKLIQSDKNTPFYLLTGIARQAGVYASQIQTLPRIIWSETDNYNALFYNGKKVSIAGLSRFVHQLEAEAMEIFRTKLLLGANVPALGDPENPDSTVYQDMLSSERVHYSFLVDPANPVLTDTATSGYVIRHILSNDDLSRKFFGADGKSFDNLAFAAYMDAVASFVDRLLLLTHISIGQPCRGRELLCTTIVNSQMGGIRSLFFSHGRLMLVQYYNKSRHKVNYKERFIARFYPKSVSRLVIMYLALIRPVERFITRKLYANDQEAMATKLSNYQLYLFVQHGQVVSNNYLSRVMGTFTLKHLDVQLQLNAYRHIAIAFMSVRIQAFIDQNQIEDSPDYDVPSHMLRGRAAASDSNVSSLLYNEQASHTSQIAQRVYAYSSKDYGYIGKFNMNNYFMCSLSWQQLLGYSLPDCDKISLMQQKPTPIDLRTTVTDISTVPQPVPKRRMLNEDGSYHECHTVCDGADTSIFSRVCVLQDDSDVLETDVKVSYLMALRAFMNKPTAHFKSISQAAAMAIVLEGVRDLLYISSTGSGKSLMFFLSSFYYKHLTTIVVVPMVSLKADMVQRCRMHNLTCDIWNTEYDTMQNVNVLFVATEDANKSTLHGLIKKLHKNKRLARIVFDEVHLTLTANDWRPAMAYAFTLRVVPVPILLLSATVPPAMENELKIKFASNFAVLRSVDSTARPGIAYSVHLLAKMEPYDSVLLNAVKKHLVAGCRGIVYANSITECKQAQQMLQKHFTNVNVLLYHASLEAKAAQQSIFMEQNSDMAIMVATCAFAVGIDKEDIRFVFHVGIPDSILEYAQASGRAKRSESSFPGPADCKIIVSQEQVDDLIKFRLSNSKLPSIDRKKDELLSMSSYVTTTGCRRYAIQKVLDKVAVSCSSSPEYALCDNCHLAMEGYSQKPTVSQKPTDRNISVHNSDSSPDSGTDDDEEYNAFTVQMTDLGNGSGSHGINVLGGGSHGSNHGFNGGSRDNNVFGGGSHGSSGFSGGSHGSSGSNGGSHSSNMFGGGSHESNYGFSGCSRGLNGGSHGSNVFGGGSHGSSGFGGGFSGGSHSSNHGFSSGSHGSNSFSGRSHDNNGFDGGFSGGSHGNNGFSRGFSGGSHGSSDFSSEPHGSNVFGGASHGSNGFSGGSHGSKHGFNGGSHSSNNNKGPALPGFIPASRLNVQSSAGLNNERLKQANMVLKDVENYVGWLGGRCAVCTLSEVWHHKTEERRLVHDLSRCIQGSRCYKCYVRDCGRDKCEIFVEIKKKYGEICYMCFMYINKIYDINFHTNGLLKCTYTKGKDKIICICYWLWEKALENQRCKEWMLVFVDQESLSRYEAYTKFLLAQDNATGLYNYFIVISNLFKFLEQNGFQRTPKDL